MGYRAGSLSQTANPSGVIPNATFGGVPTPGNLTIEVRFPLYNRYKLFNWADNLTVNRGSHTFKAGIYIERFYRNQKKAVPFKLNVRHPECACLAPSGANVRDRHVKGLPGEATNSA